MLPSEAGLVGRVEVLSAAEHDSPATTPINTGPVDFGDPYGRTRAAVKIDELGVEDTQAVVQRRDDASVRAVFISQSELIHVAHHGAVGHRRPSVLSEAAHGPLHDAFGFNAGFLVVDHEEIVELHGANVDPLGTFLAVPGSEAAEDGRLGGFRAAPSVLHGEEVGEDPKSEPALRVHGVVVKLPQGNPLLADVSVKGRAVGVIVHAVPEAEVSPSRGGVVPDDVVGIGDPVGGGSDVVVQQAGALFDKHSQVVLQDVLGLNAVLDEEGTAHDVVDDVVLHQQPVGVVDGDGPVEGLMDSTTPHVGLVVDVSHQMPVDGITSESEGLSCMEELRNKDIQTLKLQTLRMWIFRFV